MIPESSLQRVLDSVSMVQIVSSYVTLEQKGGRYWGCCPFHNEKTPSFSVTEDKKLYYCFGCNKGGSLFNFVMELEGISFIEAVKLVAEKGGVALDIDSQQENDEQYKHKSALSELYKRVAASFEYILHETKEGKEGLNYLRDRGISGETIRSFQIGFSPADTQWLYKFLVSKGYSEGFLAKTGLFSQRYPKFPLFSGRVMIPIKSIRGEIVAFGGRLLSGDGPKYINSPETALYSKRTLLFNIDTASQEIRRSKTFFICEGYFDVIALFQSGFSNAVAPLGTALTSEQIRLLKRYSQKGCLLFDSDDAGIEASLKSLKLAEQLNIQLDVIPVLKGKDPAEILQKEGSDALHKLLKYPINSFDYLLSTSLDKMDISTPEGKELVVKRLFPYINSVDSSIRRDEYKKVLCERLDISPESLNEEMNKVDSGKQTKSELVVPKAYSAIPDINTPELFLLMGVLSKPMLFKEVRRFISLDELSSELGKDIYIALEECFRRDNLTFESVTAGIKDENILSFIIKRIASGEFAQNTESVVRDAMLKVKIDSLGKKRDKVEKKLNQNVDSEKLKELLSEKMYLDGELDKLRLKRNDRSSE